MRPTLLMALALLTACAHVPVSCGTVGALAVSVESGTVLTCEEALSQAQRDARALESEGRALGQPWRLLYTWRYVGLDMAGRPLWGVTRPAERTSFVRVFFEGRVYRQGPAALHELRHASDAMRGIVRED